MSIHKKNILFIDKPKGPTSFDIIRKLQRICRTKKIGHAGTLDPSASGLLIVGINEGTKKLTDYFKLPKTYEAEIILGESRTTGDREGVIIKEEDIHSIDHVKIKKALGGLLGSHLLPVSIYSAIRQGGEKLYKRARSGKPTITPKREMVIHQAALNTIEQKENRVHVYATFHVESGTYIRSLAEELGRRLDYPATLGNLRRTKVGNFDIKDATQLQEITSGTCLHTKEHT